MNPELSESERGQIATILSRRANEIAMYKSEHYKPINNQEAMPASVEYALEREIERLRRLAGKLAFQETEE